MWPNESAVVSKKPNKGITKVQEWKQRKTGELSMQGQHAILNATKSELNGKEMSSEQETFLETLSTEEEKTKKRRGKKWKDKLYLHNLTTICF